MLHLLILLLKIIGIILLVILALVLLILGIILLSPFNYQAVLRFYEEPDVSAKIRWLFFVFKVDVEYHNGRLDLTAKVLNKMIVDRHTGHHQSPSKDDEEGTVFESEDAARVTDDQLGSVSDTELDIDKIGGKNTESVKMDLNVSNDDEQANDSSDLSEKQHEMEKLRLLTETKDELPKIETDIEKKERVDSEEQIDESTKTGLLYRIIEKIRMFLKKNTDYFHNLSSNIKNKKTKLSVSQRLALLLERLMDKLDLALEQIDNRIENIEKKTDAFIEKKDLAEKLLASDYIQKTIEFSKRMLHSIVSHILPRKLKGYILFGLGDPAMTGKILGYSSMLYPLYGDKLEVIPDFTKSVIEGELKMKGHIQLGIFVMWIMKGLLDKNVRKSVQLGLRIKKTRSFKEDILWQ